MSAEVTIVRQAAILRPDQPRRYKGADLGHSRIRALRPLVEEIHERYNAKTPFEQALARADWTHRIFPHPDLPPYLNASSTNNKLWLPEGQTWADAKALNPYGIAKQTADNQFWDVFFQDGTKMLDAQLGTLDLTTGLRADDGQLRRIGPAQYRVRNLGAYRWSQCTYQNAVLQALHAAAGCQSMFLRVGGHDPAAVLLPDTGWAYCDSTYAEMYTLADGTPLSVIDLWGLTQQGRTADAVTRRMQPLDDPQVFMDVSYLRNAEKTGTGMDIVAAALDNRIFGLASDRRWVRLNAGKNAPAIASYLAVDARYIVPDVGVGVATQTDNTLSLVTNWAGHEHFEQRHNSGAWLPCGSTVSPAPGTTEYRSVSIGGAGSPAAVVQM